MTERGEYLILLIFIFLSIAGYLLPTLQGTRMLFLEQILTGKKKVLLAKNVPSRVIP